MSKTYDDILMGGKKPKKPKSEKEDKYFILTDEKGKDIKTKSDGNHRYKGDTSTAAAKKAASVFIKPKLPKSKNLSDADIKKYKGKLKVHMRRSTKFSKKKKNYSFEVTWSLRKLDPKKDKWLIDTTGKNYIVVKHGIKLK